MAGSRPNPSQRERTQVREKGRERQEGGGNSRKKKRPRARGALGFIGGVGREEHRHGEETSREVAPVEIKIPEFEAIGVKRKGAILLTGRTHKCSFPWSQGETAPLKNGQA